MDELYQLMMGEQPDAAASAQAMARALRGDRQLAGINAVAGGGLGALGALQAAEAKQQSDLMEKGLAARLHYGQETRQADRDAKARALQLTLAARADENEKNRTAAFERLTAQLAGAQKRAETAKPGSSASDDREYDKAQSDIIKFSNDIAAEKARGTAVGLAAQNIYRARAGEKLIVGKYVTPQFAHDFAINLARIAGGGGQVGERMAEQLKMKGIGADVASIKQYLTGKPVDIGMKETVDLFVDKMRQEEEVASDFVREGALRQVPRMGRAAKFAPEDLARVLKGHNLDNYVNDDLLTTVAPAAFAHRVGKAEIAAARKKLEPGERLAYSPDGKAKALGAGESLPGGWWEPK